MVKWVIKCALVSVLIVGCASQDNSQYMRDGVQYGVTAGVFRGRWWSYYERGASYLSGKYYEEAASDFQTALINRSQDSWRARTYGLHFTPYFPNRELGIAYYYMERHEEAAAMLEKAVEMVDTARGHHYLSLTKRALIARGLLDDRDRPAIAADLADGALFTEHILPIQIAATDDLGVASVRLNNHVLPQRTERAEVQFREQLQLREGTHEIEIAVTDLADKEYTEKRTFTVDMTGPTIGLFTPTDAMVVDAPVVSIEGVCVDEFGVAEVVVGQRPVAVATGETRVPFRAEVALVAGENRIHLTARDLAGNETHSQVVVYHGDARDVAAHLWLLKQRAPDLLLLAQEGGQTTLPDVPDSSDRIILRSPSPDRPNRHNRAVRVAGEVIADSGVASLVINDQPFEQLTGAPKEVFSRRIPIEEEMLLEVGGNMRIVVHAEDNEGHDLEEAVEVELRPITLNTKESHMPVAVLAFEGHDAAAAMTEAMRASLQEHLLSRARFRALERTELLALLTEQELSAALGNPAEALRLGKITPAHVLLIGDVFPHGEGIEVKVRIVNTETSDIVAIIDGYATPDNIAAAGEVLAVQLERLYPRLSGELIAVRERGSNTELYFDWTVDDGVLPGAYALIVHEEPAWYDEVLGVYFDQETHIIGRARIEDVSENISRARPDEILTEEIKLEQGMAAITM